MDIGVIDIRVKLLLWLQYWLNISYRHPINLSTFARKPHFSLHTDPGHFSSKVENIWSQYQLFSPQVSSENSLPWHEKYKFHRCFTKEFLVWHNTPYIPAWWALPGADIVPRHRWVKILDTPTHTQLTLRQTTRTTWWSISEMMNFENWNIYCFKERNNLE